MEMILRARAIKIIILPGERVTRNVPERDLGGGCRICPSSGRARWDLQGSFITATSNCRKSAPKKHRGKECEGRLPRRSVSISPFVLMRML